jgi:hypothetical protein
MNRTCVDITVAAKIINKPEEVVRSLVRQQAIKSRDMGAIGRCPYLYSLRNYQNGIIEEKPTKTPGKAKVNTWSYEKYTRARLKARRLKFPDWEKIKEQTLTESGYKEYPLKAVIEGYWVLLDEQKNEVMTEHKYLVKNKLKEEGKKLKRSEVIHHVDGNKLNNDIDNLKVMQRSDHARIHLKVYARGKNTKNGVNRRKSKKTTPPDAVIGNI